MSIAVRLGQVRITPEGRVGGHDAGATLVRRLLRVFPGAQVVGPPARRSEGVDVVPLTELDGARTWSSTWTSSTRSPSGRPSGLGAQTLR
ncbi:hypothetical protein ACFSBG_17085 [Georgenia yuyongxinii]|uniref:hypothetical protein n=1 Tax=Georgenia yuyongxinii TaxID=2589797 RepID=UPI001E3BFA70|nr:hypothetical protein [Georgenia yuyongxinii]